VDAEATTIASDATEVSRKVRTGALVELFHSLCERRRHLVKVEAHIILR
jgi:hypothetical protein